jgi:methionyl aminopeptidase
MPTGDKELKLKGRHDMTVTATEIEGTGDNYELEKLLDVRLRTRHAVYKIASSVHPGMVEEDTRVMARDVLKSLGMRRGWHHIITRLGPNTTKDFMALSERGVVLEENDIFFIDIGPIYGDTEGDAGETFVVGANPEHHRAKADVRAIWDDVRETWFTTGATGQDLYEFAKKAARDRGWELNLDLSGHRLSDFPHFAHYDGSLADIGFRPSPNLWVLEIAIIHPDRTFGAFYEDLLLADQSFPEWALAAEGFPLAADGFPSAAAGFPLSADGRPLGE